MAAWNDWFTSSARRPLPNVTSIAPAATDATAAPNPVQSTPHRMARLSVVTPLPTRVAIPFDTSLAPFA
jgi:hypothetical protein